jgi:hypothetical protein
MGPEDCTNGLDDDGDGLVDCEDTDCDPGFACVPKKPGGWNGPIALYDGDPAASPGCPVEFPAVAYEGNDDLVPMPAVCTGCTCGAPGVTCTPAPLVLHGNAQCANQTGSAAQPQPGQCGPIQPPNGTAAYSAAAPQANAGACQPSMVTTMVPPPTWQTTGLACGAGATGTGCGATSICAPRAPSPFGAGLCVYRSGDHACPAGYGVKHLYYDNVVDSRGCDPCTCAPAVASCAATTTVFADGVCIAPSLSVPNDGSCKAGPVGGTITIQVTPSGSCMPTGGAPHGTVVPGALTTTVCCTQ